MVFRVRERISIASRKALGEVQRLRREKGGEAFEKSRRRATLPVLVPIPLKKRATFSIARLATLVTHSEMKYLTGVEERKKERTKEKESKQEKEGEANLLYHRKEAL